MTNGPERVREAFLHLAVWESKFPDWIARLDESEPEFPRIIYGTQDLRLAYFLHGTDWRAKVIFSNYEQLKVDSSELGEFAWEAWREAEDECLEFGEYLLKLVEDLPKPASYPSTPQVTDHPPIPANSQPADSKSESRNGLTDKHGELKQSSAMLIGVLIVAIYIVGNAIPWGAFSNSNSDVQYSNRIDDSQVQDFSPSLPDIQSPSVTGGGSFVVCQDGSTSNSGGKQGACSWHGGVTP
jgi:hypothetical protein